MIEKLSPRDEKLLSLAKGERALRAWRSPWIVFGCVAVAIGLMAYATPWDWSQVETRRTVAFLVIVCTTIWLQVSYGRLRHDALSLIRRLADECDARGGRE